MKLKILTINIWRYYEWKKRKRKAIKFLKEQDADIVILQEVAYDERLKEKYKNQLEEINKDLGYENYILSKLTKMNKWHAEPINWEMWYGLGVLSKYPIKNTELVILPRVKKERDFGFLHIVLETPGGDINLINVHFENTDGGSKEHLKQTLEWCKKRDITPIIAGDFNMRIFEDLKNMVEKEYFISYKIKNYFSFLPSEFTSDEKPITIDYIIAHKSEFEIKLIECTEEKISDHNPLIAYILFNKLKIKKDF